MRKHARSLVRVLGEQLGAENIKFGVEVGVWQGELSADLLRMFLNLHLTMVDLWKPFADSTMHAKDNNDKAMEQALVTAKQNTSFASDRRLITRRSSIAEARHWSDEKFDFGFIDADHKSVPEDLPAWWKKIRSGGIVAGHDYDGIGDRRKGWGVKKAVDDFFARIGLKVHVEPGLVWWVKKSSS